MSKAFRYLFPPRSAREQLPLLPTSPVGKYSRYGAAPDEMKQDIQLLIGLGLATNEHDAHIILRKHAGKPIHKIVKLEKRQRRRTPWYIRTWQRIKAMW